MNYHLTYSRLIARAQARHSIDGYFETHHIMPKSLGGTNDKSNLVKLTAREHFIAHCLLARIHGGAQWATIIYFKGNKQSYFNSRLYESAKQRLAHEVSIRMSGRTPWNKDKKGLQKSWNKGLKCPAVSEKMKGVKRPEHSERMKGNTFASATKGKPNLLVSEKLKGRPSPMIGYTGKTQDTIKRFAFGYL